MTPTPPPFDPELAAALALVADAAPTGLTLESLAAQRAATDALPSTLDELRAHGLVDTEELTVPGTDSVPEIPLLVCRPPGLVGPRPVVYYMHGGGMVMGSNRHGLDVALEWALELDAVLVSVEYRLAPEHPHPAPVEDCYTGLLWTTAHAAEIGGDPGRVVLAGTSAGGGLAAAVALLARDRKGPAVVGQVLMCPMLDDRNDTPSAHQMAGLGLWDRASNATGWRALLGELAPDVEVSPYAAPARSVDLSGLPPAFIDVGSAETFRDEDIAYATGIWLAGGEAELHVWPGGFHAFDAFAPHAGLSQEARTSRLRWLRRLLGD
ncbi:alpha/beta hydrolase [Streptomyces sp. SKN60]|uniref:alpha/beta hydrolase n=1 Tax=Streptomyces sp. SKN60 TaxID=2855506 RepID=UPI00224828CF|nr:alpha/beta hydrolase [Streptomyces sp. SKN60]MCX2181944.1 alpha/beta hydrolase [Streptomyces sp. SKN60]